MKAIKIAGFVSAGVLGVCGFAALPNAVSAADINSAVVGCDTDNDGHNDYEFDLKLLTNTGECVVTGVTYVGSEASYLGNVDIPEKFENVQWYDRTLNAGEVTDFAVTGVNLIGTDTRFSSVSVPFTVNDNCVNADGYYRDYDKFSGKLVLKNVNMLAENVGVSVQRLSSGANEATIEKNNINGALVKLSSDKYTYNGKSCTPEVSVKYMGLVLKNGSDYTVKYSKNKTAGKAKVTVSGKGIFAGKITQSFSVDSKKPTELKVSEIKPQTYTGKAIVPSFTVEADGQMLKSGIDYMVSYADNVSPGKAKANITLKGNYSGKTTAEYVISQPTTYTSGSRSSQQLIGARLDSVKLSSHRTYAQVNTQGDTNIVSNVTLSDTDIATIKKFISENCPAGMSRVQVLTIVARWINRNVTYASSAENWAKIVNKTYVDAIFNYKLGQCAQYNGAMIGVMAYLGYDVKLIQGYRGVYTGSKWQHFWGEVEIGGKNFLIETGNYGDSGDWWYLAEDYTKAGGYIINKKPALTE